MRLALSLGRRGLGRVAPNPAVGCVIVREGGIVGRGVTAPGGRPHAEVQALEQAGEAARGATAYVTLEPCSHHGKSPPCADALVAAGVARVVVAMEDPNPLVAGQGLARMRAAGIEVVTGIMEDEARRDHAGFLKVIGQGLPMLTLKLAASFDGRIATAAGESRWITGGQARRLVHGERARHDAVMVGGGTARADDPMLDVRGLGIAHQPVRVVLTRGLDLPLTGRLAASAGEVPLWLVHGPGAEPGLVRAWEGLGARLIAVHERAGRLDVTQALAALAEAGLTRVFCEGGGQLGASLLDAGLVDRLVGFTAGLALGADGRPALGPMGIARLADAPRFDLMETRAVGGDVLHVWEARGARPA
ncbi:MAG TPA: bifunctional diaminohydroxyphosphoribosylaminopyrimidine deaminase/5-amino-6-(5-phosphoribosylamino)uracil reductase RibD [Aliiroseovarius sp.]|nr:bifunctional diaminohydroxyphosphoribosylaminopyrimidine deaminase/5-amino-6-(5-phosphoribosylamino)uracil reductase RibD [Aliiroseovarius sp.]